MRSGGAFVLRPIVGMPGMFGSVMVPNDNGGIELKQSGLGDMV